MAGLTGLRSGLLVKKPTEFLASDARLVRRLEPLRCDKSHDHAQLDGRTPGIPCDKAKDVARWPRNLCLRIANGCEQVLTEDFGRRKTGGRQRLPMRCEFQLRMGIEFRLAKLQATPLKEEMSPLII